MNEKIIVIGHGEHARMVIDNIEEHGKYHVFGLTTCNAEDVNRRVMGYRVVCLDEQIEIMLRENHDIVGFILGMGDMKVRSVVSQKLAKVLSPVNIIHPAAIVSRHAQIGNGNLLEAYTKIANGVTMGSHCIVNSFSAVNHDQLIEDNVLIAGNVSMAGRKIGCNTIIADGASIAFKKSVGANCIVGDGAVVTKDLPDNVIAYGNPAKSIKSNDWPVS